MRTKIIILSVIAAFALNANAQVEMENVEEAPVIAFEENQNESNVSVYEHAGNIYFNLVSNNESESGFYTFERSFDKSNYIILNKKDFQPTIENEKLLFSFVNKLPEKDAAYRIYRFTPQKVSMMYEYNYTADPSKFVYNED